jgi:GDPmannose 4,6-dehydratase
MIKIAIVSGVTGQDGSYLCDILIERGYKVYGFTRRSARSDIYGNVKHLVGNPNFELVEGDIQDIACIERLCRLVKPSVLFNMCAQSHVATSFEQPIYTCQVTGMGVLNCLEAIRNSGIHTKFLTASSSEMYGGISPEPSNEQTPFVAKSPYAAAKLFGHYITQVYRSTYNMFACTTICFNHEGPRRHESFVSRKITKAVANILYGKQDALYLGNLDAKRDWGYAKDYCEGMVDILTKTADPSDYVLSTGETHSVREFCEIAFNYAGLDYRDYVKVDPKFYRPCEVNVLLGDYSKINRVLGWEPKVKFKELVEIMVKHDLEQAK